MEFASYLAGEKWSDRPACTHPALAELARAVNDHVDDRTRQQLVPMVPDVIGLNADLPLVDVWIARECALTALPSAAESRQRVMALGVLRCEEAIARAQGRAPRSLTPRAQIALAAVPLAHLWAARFSQETWNGRASFHRISAAAIIDYAVLGISESTLDDPGSVLVQLLRDMIEQCRSWFETAELTASPAAAPARH